MCIIVDTNTFKSVFDKTSEDHENFAPVLNWILEGDGKLVFGGTKYKEELKKATKYLKIFGQFARSRKTIEIDEKQVNDYQAVLESKLKHRDFDDPHIVAICFVSKCNVICTQDKRAFPYLSKKEFYPKNSPRPKIYSGKSNKDLLCRKYFASICEPCLKLNKVDVEALKKSI